MPKIEYEYIREDTFFLANQGDPDLSGRDGSHAIRVELPTLESFFGKPWEEAIKLIDGYGLEPRKQKFDYYRDELKLFKLPPKLEGLIETLSDKMSAKAKQRVTPSVEQIFDAIEEQPSEYKDEIDWIKLQKKRSVQGYWCLIKGKVTYIDGDHYTYLIGCEIANPFRNKQGDTLPFYRDIDRRHFLFFKWAQTTTESMFSHRLTGRVRGEFVEKYFNKEKSARMYAKKNMVFYEIDEGRFYIDLGRRTVSGVVWAARRGGGKTYAMGHKGTKIAMNTPNGRFAMQARSLKTGKDDVYAEKVRMPFESMPFYLKPSSQIQADGIKFYPKTSSALAHDIQRHNGRVFVRSSEMTSVDGNRVHAYGNDESGKDKDGNVLSDYNGTVKKMISLGGEIIGFAMYFSTFGEFEKGGKAFFELFKASISHKRNDLGRTMTGLVAYFTPAYDGYDDCIDEYGYSIIDDPDEPYINLTGKRMDMGAKTILTINRDQWKEAGNMINLNEEIRDNAWTIREAARKVMTSESWDMAVLDARIEYLEFDDNAPQPRIVNLEWEGGTRTKYIEKDGKRINTGQLSNVIIKDVAEGEEGRFKLHLEPPDEWKNKKQYDHFSGNWSPDPNFRHRYVLGCDPFAMDLKDTTGKKLSMGGGIMHFKRDYNIDPDDMNIHSWTSCTTAMTYCMRADTTDEYCDDMLKAAVLFSSMVSSERNVTHVLKKFREWGCSGYLLHLTNPITGELDPVAGVRTQGEAKQNLFASVRDYVKNHAHRERSLELLLQIRNTETMDDLTDNDLVASQGVALMGSESRHITELDESAGSIDMSNEYLY